MRETTQRSEAAAERPEHDHDGEHDDDHDDAAAEARRAAWARLLAEAQRLFDAAPRFRIEFERDGTVSLREKAFRPCMDAPPEAATIWRIVSGHPTLEEAERRLGAEWQWRPTQRPGHAVELARAAAAEGAPVVAAFGGDGTVGDVARGILGSDAALGILPMGTGNDVARNLGLPLDLGVACDTLAAGKTRRVDMGAINDTPFLNNAATVLMLAPIAGSLAKQLGLNPDAFLMAVAIGAACDFLTPIGHQCNTLVMGPGGYRFGDYARLGAPLSLLVVLCGVPLILAIWPLR